MRAYKLRLPDAEESIGRIVDSGASHHITPDRTLFTGVVRKCRVPVSGIDGDKGLTAVGVGAGKIVVDGVTVALDRLYFVPVLNPNFGFCLVACGRWISLHLRTGKRAQHAHAACPWWWCGVHSGKRGPV